MTATTQLERFVRTHRRLFVITGAGVSAPSGIATYRDHNGDWQHPQPVMHQAFVNEHGVRQRYWARSMRGWSRFASARANAAHHSLVALEETGRVGTVVTQNVDGLHQQAGQRSLIELHGSLAEVICLACGDRTRRQDVQAWLEDHNPAVLGAPAAPAPDGDAELHGREDSADVAVPVCRSCGGVLKPDVVFYGDSVPRARVAQAFSALEQSDAVLVVGSSLMVYSSYRFCRRAAQLGLPMAALNLGTTRADEWFATKVAADCAIVLPALLAAVAGSTLEQ